MTDNSLNFTGDSDWAVEMVRSIIEADFLVILMFGILNAAFACILMWFFVKYLANNQQGVAVTPPEAQYHRIEGQAKIRNKLKRLEKQKQKDNNNNDNNNNNNNNNNSNSNSKSNTDSTILKEKNE